VPVDVIEDRERLTAWARKAVRSQRRKTPNRKPRRTEPRGRGQD
jgi:hypothetical protein